MYRRRLFAQPVRLRRRGSRLATYVAWPGIVLALSSVAVFAQDDPSTDPDEVPGVVTRRGEADPRATHIVGGEIRTKSKFFLPYAHAHRGDARRWIEPLWPGVPQHLVEVSAEGFRMGPAAMPQADASGGWTVDLATPTGPVSPWTGPSRATLSPAAETGLVLIELLRQDTIGVPPRFVVGCGSWTYVPYFAELHARAFSGSSDFRWRLGPDFDGDPGCTLRLVEVGPDGVALAGPARPNGGRLERGDAPLPDAAEYRDLATWLGSRRVVE